MILAMVMWSSSAAAQATLMSFHPMLSVILGSLWVVPGRISLQVVGPPHDLAHQCLMMLMTVLLSCAGLASRMSSLAILGSFLHEHERVSLWLRGLLLVLMLP